MHVSLSYAGQWPPGCHLPSAAIRRTGPGTNSYAWDLDEDCPGWQQKNGKAGRRVPSGNRLILRPHQVLQILVPVVMDSTHFRRFKLTCNPQILQAAGRYAQQLSHLASFQPGLSCSWTGIRQHRFQISQQSYSGTCWKAISPNPAVVTMGFAPRRR